MAGGLLNLVSYGAENIILNGNPNKTFFKAVYKKYTNFGLQRFRLLYEGQRTLSFNSETEFVFKIPRYAEMLWDTYLVLNLPNIWSPLHWRGTADVSGGFVPYNFQWIRNIGTTILRRVTIYSGGGALLAEYNGEWMTNVIQRDEGVGKTELFNRMTGNIPELYDPASMYECKKQWWLPPFDDYPNAIYDASCAHRGIEPSIHGRRLYIPLLAWFCYSPKTALPLIAMQYQEVSIKFEFRPVSQWFTVYDVAQQKKGDNTVCPPIPPLYSNLDPPPRRIAPPPQNDLYQMWRFLQPPADISASNPSYINRRQDWDVDIHLMATYIFLSNDERRQMAAQNHNYLVKTQHTHDFLNATGSRRVNLNSRNLVSSYMFRFRRSDVNLRNEWTNYTNWPYQAPPQLPTHWKPSGSLTNTLNLQWAGCRNIENIKHILLNMGILCGGEYRENMHHVGVYDYIEKWRRTSGLAKDGLYIYNFCIDSNRMIYQPSGAQNTNMWKYITFEYNTIQPPALSEECPSQFDTDVICDPSGRIIGMRKDHWQLNQYNYDLRIFEERYNMIVITSGRIGLLDAR